MIEKIVRDYLEETLSIQTYMEMPEEQPEEFILIEKTGSSKEDFINSATIVLQSYAGSMYLAATLNENVKKAMENIIYSTDISKAALNTDYNFTDTTRKKYRYQAVYDLFY